MADRIPLADAERIAAHVVAALAPHCTRIAVAGSIRRRSPTCKDVEIVAIPKTVPHGLYGDWEARDPEFAAAANQWQHVKGDAQDGRYMQRRVSVPGPAHAPEAFTLTATLDLFVATPETWGVVLALRTGPADFSKRLVTRKSAGGSCPSHLLFRDGGLWQGFAFAGRKAAITTQIPVPEEEDLFRLLGVPMPAPEDRA